MDFNLLFIYFASLSVIIPGLLSFHIYLRNNKKMTYLLSYCIVFSIVESSAGIMASNGIHNLWFYNIAMIVQFFIFSKVIDIKNQLIIYGVVIFSILNYFFGEGIKYSNSISFNVQNLVIIILGLRIIQQEYLKSINLKSNFRFLFTSLIVISKIFYFLFFGIFNQINGKIRFLYDDELNAILGLINLTFYTIWTYLLWKQHFQTKL